MEKNDDACIQGRVCTFFFGNRSQKIGFFFFKQTTKTTVVQRFVKRDLGRMIAPVWDRLF